MFVCVHVEIDIESVPLLIGDDFFLGLDQAVKSGHGLLLVPVAREESLSFQRRDEPSQC
jgi:hypothetical protein